MASLLNGFWLEEVVFLFFKREARENSFLTDGEWALRVFTMVSQNFLQKERKERWTTKIKRENNFCNLGACWTGLDENKVIWIHNPINKINTKRLNQFLDFKIGKFNLGQTKHGNRKFWKLIVTEYVSLQNFLKMPFVTFSFSFFLFFFWTKIKRKHKQDQPKFLQ